MERRSFLQAAAGLVLMKDKLKLFDVTADDGCEWDDTDEEESSETSTSHESSSTTCTSVASSNSGPLIIFMDDGKGFRRYEP